MKTTKNIFKGCLLTLLSLILLPITIMVYAVGFLEMLGRGFGYISDTVLVTNFEMFRDEIQNKIKEL